MNRFTCAATESGSMVKESAPATGLCERQLTQRVPARGRWPHTCMEVRAMPSVSPRVTPKKPFRGAL